MRSSVRNSSSPSGMLQSRNFAFVPGIFSVPFKYPLVQSIERRSLSLFRAHLSQREGSFSSIRAGLAKALDRNERPFCAALRWARSVGRSDAIVVQCHQPSPINRRLSPRDSGDALMMMMMMLTAFARVFTVNSACEDHSLKLAKTLISQEQDEHGRGEGER